MRLDCTGDRPRIDLQSLDPRPTAEQRSALAHDRELAVTAGAGAGKTQTLSLRYAVLLLDVAVAAVLADRHRPRPDVEQVLVLTFTEKAAEEMADRCYRRLLALGRAARAQVAELDARFGEGFGRALAAAVEHLVDTFDRAAISTFHGFCARLLRELPAETGTPPGFEILEEADSLEVQEEAIEAALQALYATESEGLGILYDAFNRREDLATAVRAVLAAGGRLEPRLRAHAAGEVTLSAWLDEADPDPRQVRAWLEGTALPLLDEVLALVEPGGSSWARHTLAPLVRRLEAVGDDALGGNGLYREVLEAFAGTNGARSLTHYSVMGRSGDWPSTPLRKRHKQSLEGLQRRLSDFPERLEAARTLPVEADRALLRALRHFARLALDAIARQRALLDARRAVDFAELQRRAVAAVTGDPALRARLCARYRYLMVDEFQDTDEGQWALIEALGRPCGGPDDRVFFVGDVKQAIYGFRGGDVTVFDTATRALGVEPLVLHDNFRSRDGLIGWFNAVFGTVLGPPRAGRPPWEAPYEPLRAGRGESGGSVLLVPHEQGGSAAETAEAEADAVARFVGGQVLAGRGDYAGVDWLDHRAFPAPPVAVLLQRRTWQPLFERALRAHGVPFVVARGVGFWSRPEVLDLVNALHALATDDPISVLGALRSPLFAVPDTDLFEHGVGRGAVFRRFGRGPVPERASPHVARAWERFAVLRAVRDRLPVSALLRRLISEGAAWHAWALDDDHGLAEANAQRLVQIAARFDGRGPEGLETVADWFVRRVEEAEREDEAAVMPTAARVVLMTVHAAKGLEFPVVVVPQAGAASSLVPPPLAVRRTVTGWDLAFRVAEAAADPGTGARGIRALVHPGRLVALRAIQAAEESAESRRLLYVAATRARDHLVVVGKVGRNGPAKGSWMAHLAEHHGSAFAPRDGAQVADLSALRAVEPRSLRQPRLLPVPPPDAARRLGPVHAAPEIEISPSSLDLFVQCPARWVLRHVLRVPEEREASGAATPWGARLAGVRGEVLHSLLEDDVADDEGVAAARWRARAHAVGCPPDEVEALLPVLLRHARTAAADPELRAILAGEGLAEATFALDIGGVTLRGQIDRLWFDRATGEWVVLDYKSEAVPHGPLVAGARHERQLRAYAWAASRILQAHGHPPVRRGLLYFTAVGAFYRYQAWTDADFAALEALMREVGDAAITPWAEIERQAVDGPKPRPCASCAFRGRTCRGQGLAVRERRDDRRV